MMPEFYRTVLAIYFRPRDLVFLETLVCQLQTYTTITNEHPRCKQRGITSLHSHASRLDVTQQHLSDAVLPTAASGWESNP